MVVEDFAKTRLMEDSDDDDMPLVFKRSSATSKLNQSNSSSQKHDGRVAKQVSDIRSPSGQSTSSLKVETVTSAKTSPAVSPLASPKASPSSGKTSETFSAPSSRRSTSANYQSKVINQHRSNTVAKVVKPTVQTKLEPNDDAQDSEDDKPLCARLSSGLPKRNPYPVNKVPGTSASVEKSGALKPEDSHDEIPLASRFQLKSNARASTSKSCNSPEVQPLGTKVHKNGSASIAILSKRLSCEVKSTAQASVKKPRISEASASVNSKNASVKTETKAERDDDDDDDVPISYKIKKSATSANKLSSPLKSTKVVSSSLKKTKSKLKTEKKSKFSKSSEVPPSSGEGQKWTTLVHNGVIFPPPYKPHGVKILYKGKPVDLTPEQEEICICLLCLCAQANPFMYLSVYSHCSYFLPAGCSNVCSDARH